MEQKEEHATKNNILSLILPIDSEELQGPAPETWAVAETALRRQYPGTIPVIAAYC